MPIRALTESLVETEDVADILKRASTYLDAGLAVNLSGPAGVGKTTLALHLANKRGRPVVLLHGDDILTSADLVGSPGAYERRTVVDNYVRSVLKVRDEINQRWQDNQLAMAVKGGCTLVYDEYTRSRAVANNVLLPVLSEGVMPAPPNKEGNRLVDVDPAFRLILTSNPLEYAGVHQPPNALADRVVTINIPGYDAATETAIAARRSGLDTVEAAKVVAVTRTFPGAHPSGSVRPAIAIARVLAAHRRKADPESEFFRSVCQDVLGLAGLTRADLLRAVTRRDPEEQIEPPAAEGS